MTTIWLTTGLPASGKSTWAKQMVKDANGNMIRVNLDDLRVMLGIDPASKEPIDKELGKVLLTLQDKAILAAVAAGKDVVIDNTHLVPTIPKRIKKLFDGEITFRVKDFTDVPVDDCLIRDHMRGLNGERLVGDKVIRDFAKLLNKPWRLTEEFMNVYEFPLEPYITDLSAPVAAVFDIDGTLAKHYRSPYDYSRLHTDAVHDNIRELNAMYWNAYVTIFIVSGRPDTYRAETEEWLKAHDIKYDHLHMRRGDDKRNDADVKHEIFNEHLRDYYIENWFDDRDRVVRRMRKLGVNVVQVREGNF